MTTPSPALAELSALERIIELGAGHLQTRVACEVPADPRDPGGARLPVHAITLGNPSPHVPAAGVDLMRNAPLDADDRVPWMVGGQRTSPGLPWYRGPAGEPMQPEARALCDLVREELLPRPFSLAIDCHSGFGTRDRLWFPYAHTRAPLRHLAEMHALQDIFERAHPLHRYIVEPQSRQYLAHGDLWDFLHLEAGAQEGGGPVFLPLTLEMGSWLWVKKNPRQLFSRHGIFNPLIRHRQERVLRVHMGLLDFISRAATGWRLWTPEGDERARHHEEALQQWY